MTAPEPKPLWSEFDLLSCSFALPPENGRHNRVTDLIYFLISTMRLMTWTWGRCRGWAQGGRGGGGAEGSIASRGVVVPRQGQALLLALAKRFLNNAQVLESDALKWTRKQATWMHEEVEKRKKSDDNDYTDANIAGLI